MADRLWHYIFGPELQRTLENHVLLCGITHSASAPVWFARDRFWEKKAGRSWTSHPTDEFYRTKREQLAGEYGGLSRIAVNPEMTPLDWNESLPLTQAARGADSPVSFDRFEMRMFMAMVEIAGFPGKRRFSVKSIAGQSWESVQVWRDRTWVDIPLEKREG